METKIEVAIYDLKLRIKATEEEIMLALKKKETLVQQLSSLEIINADKNLK